MTNESEKLISLFEKFPGIGPRQARRFVYFLLKSGNTYRNNLQQAIENLGKNIHTCAMCQRYYSGENKNACNLCANPARNNEQLMIVEKDADLDQIEKSGAYYGKYFVLGARVKLTDEVGTIPNKNKLLNLIQNSTHINEIILALPTTTEGEHTAQTIKNILQNSLNTHTTYLPNSNQKIHNSKNGHLKKTREIKITMLGRGLSTGAELEYADRDTLKNALESRN